MAVVGNVIDFSTLIEGLAATGTFDSVAAAIESGVVTVIENEAVGVFTVIEGGAAAPVTSLVDSALEIAQSSDLSATAASAGTAAVTVAKTAAGAKLMGLATIELPAVAAAAAPLAGIALGAGLYELNPSLWTKISQTLLPFCYEDNKIQAFIDYVTDGVTGELKPVMLVATAIIDALKDLFEKENVHTQEETTYTDSLGRTVVMVPPPTQIKSYGYDWSIKTINGSPEMCAQVVDISGQTWYRLFTRGGYVKWQYKTRPTASHYVEFEVGTGTLQMPNEFIGVPYTTYPDPMSIVDDPQSSRQHWLPTAGVSAPSTPVEPIVWPDTPIIIVPDPLGPDYQPIPVTPVTPMLPPSPETPLLPEYVPDPTPDKPEEWPEEEPWPSIAPFPVQPTEPNPDLPTPDWPDPDWPEIMPWPLPENPPSEWPTYPDGWPETYPTEVPWPVSPDYWPEEVPWPEAPPEWWPDGEPWPTEPDEWPEEIPWPTPWPDGWPNYPDGWPDEFPPDIPWPAEPDDWPEEVPWPETSPDWWPEGEPWPTEPDEWPEEYPWPLPPMWPIPWPDEVPYPYPYTYPYPDGSPDPYPDPIEIGDPTKQVDPYIDPWPYNWPYPDPYSPQSSDPNPYRDPSQPDPTPRPDPVPESEDPYPTPPSGEITPPNVPYIPLPFSSTTGLISVYHPTQSELLSFASWLWVTWQDATIDKIWNNPFDGVITLFELYCTPTDVGRKNIRSGFLDSGVSSETISRYTEIDCGSIGVPEYFGNYFDYSPYSKCHVFLPFIGIVELNVDDVVGHGVNITYRIDEYNGSCIAMITCAKSTVVNGESVDYSAIVYQFSGNCAVELPLAGGSQAAIKAGLLEAAAWGLGSVIGGVIGGSSLGAIGQGLAYGAASAVHSVVSSKSSVQHSGSFGSSYGAMGGKVPYIIVTRPKQIQVPNYNALYGYQAHKSVRIGDCTGYLRCREVHVISPTASDDEKARIEELLKTGVYVTE